MKNEDRQILKDINEFVLYCKGWYTQTNNIIDDIYSLLTKTPQYAYLVKSDIVQLIMNKWSRWNDTLPVNEKLTIADFWREINHIKDILHVNRKPDKYFDELALNVIMHHIRYIDPEYIEITKPIYKKGKVRSWFWKQGMTYKQLNKRAIDVFEHTDNI